MLASYARILRRSAAVTAAAAAVMVAVSAAIAGSKGALGALLGTALVAAFFAIRFSNATAFSPRLFGVTAIVCILTWSASQVTWSLRLKVPYVEPDGER